MNKIINLFGDKHTDQQLDTPDMLINRMTLVADQYDKAIVILIKDVGGVWDTEWEAAGLTNSESMMALELIQRLIMDGVLGIGT